ncbi:MAG: hypothetical protein WCK17_13000 [Verrucomicrobiota bacterium]
MTLLNPKGKPIRSEEISKDGSKKVVQNQITRKGEIRSTETIKYNSNGQQASKTVTVKRPLDLAKNSAYKGNSSIENHYDRGKYGFVYRHGSQTNIYVKVFHSSTVVVNDFHYGWHWNPAWYAPEVFYFPVYPVYPTPTYWVTDWMVAGYLSDAYWTGPVPEAGRPQPAMTVDNETKEQLRAQVESTINENKAAEKQQIAQKPEQADSDKEPKAVDDRLLKALSDPKHIYPVSNSLSVTIADDTAKGVTLTCGDLLKLEPGQGDFSGASENDFVKMRVLAAKTAPGEAKAGDVISVPLTSIQDFDNEFRSRLDQGLAEAVANKELFRN